MIQPVIFLMTLLGAVTTVALLHFEWALMGWLG